MSKEEIQKILEKQVNSEYENWLNWFWSIDPLDHTKNGILDLFKNINKKDKEIKQL